MRRTPIAVVIVASLLMGTAALPQGGSPSWFEDKIQLLSGMPMLLAAQELGITEVMGRELGSGYGPPGGAKAPKLNDVPIGVDPTKAENEPTIAANPKDKKLMVAGSHWAPDPVTGSNRCVAFYSHDRGATWSDPFPMPHLPANTDNQCADPVLAYAPDGSRVYYAYMDVKMVGPLPDYDIVVSYSDDNGMTWSAPVVVFDAVPGDYTYDKPWIGTHVDEHQSNWAYVSVTRFGVGAPTDYIAFSRSDDGGETWEAETLLEANVFPIVGQGSRPTGGLGGEVLVVWYHSGADGWLTGSLEIHVARSADYGATFDPITVAAVDDYEAPFWLGPFAFYKRWWGTMFPDVEIDPGGAAHVIYTHDPVENVPYPGAFSLTPEDGDIRYIYSHPPYAGWSMPETVNDDGMERAQGYAALETQHGGRASTLHVIWEDTRLSESFDIVGFPDNLSPNVFWDIFYSRKVPGRGVGWFRNFRVTEMSSLQDWVFTGDYNDLTTTESSVYSIFVDRRDKNLPNVFPAPGIPGQGIYDFEDDVFGSLIIAGGGTGR